MLRWLCRFRRYAVRRRVEPDQGGTRALPASSTAPARPGSRFGSRAGSHVPGVLRPLERPARAEQAPEREARSCSRPARPRPSPSATVTPSSPTGRSPRRRRRSAATTSSRPSPSTRRSSGRANPERRSGKIEVRPVVMRHGGALIDPVAAAYRDEFSRSVAILGRVLGDLDLAEDAVQDAFATGGRTLAARRRAQPPRAWIVTTARNRAIDRIRRDRTMERKVEQLERLAASVQLEAEGGRDPRRATRADLRLLPPGAGASKRRSRSRSGSWRPDHVRDLESVPRPGADARPAARAREAQDPGRRNPCRGAAGPPPARPAGGRARRDLPDLQRGLLRPRPARSSARSSRRGDPAGACSPC